MSAARGLSLFIHTILLASILHNPFHHRKAPHVKLTMDSHIDKDSHNLSRIEEYIVAYQEVRDSLPIYRDDKKMAELEVDEIAAVQKDLDALEKISDPETDPRLGDLEKKFSDDVTDLATKDHYLQEASSI